MRRATQLLALAARQRRGLLQPLQDQQLAPAAAMASAGTLRWFKGSSIADAPTPKAVPMSKLKVRLPLDDCISQAPFRRGGTGKLLELGAIS